MIDVITLIAALQLSAAQAAYIGQNTLPLREGTAEIHGRVVDDLSGKPVADLDVLVFEVDAGGVRGVGPRPRSAVARTDATGSFSVTKIASGTYQVRVTGKTHLPVCFGGSQEEPERCERVHVGNDRTEPDVVIRARPAATIKGRVLDHDGRPQPKVTLSAMCLGSAGCLNHANTDADGRFEIGSNRPGDAILMADFPVTNGATERAFYPGVWEIDQALPITLFAGQPVYIEFRLPKAVMGSINARVRGPEGYQLERFELSESDGSMRALEGAAVTIDNLREGRYLLEARGSARGKQYAGFKRVNVSDGQLEVFIDLEEAGVVDGRVIAERGGLPPMKGGAVSAWWVLDDDVVGAVKVDVAADGTFSFGNVFGDRIFKVIGLAPGWRVVSIRADRKDITDDVLHIASGSRTEVTITVGRQ